MVDIYHGTTKGKVLNVDAVESRVSMHKTDVKIFSSRGDLLPFADIVRQKAESDRIAFGFLPEVAYHEAAVNEKLLVAVSPDDNSYKGHLIYGGVFPRGRVFQVFVDPSCRQQGIAKVLFDQLFDILNGLHFTQISARVASDLSAANALYEKVGFKTLRQVDGKSKNRRINLRVRDLEAPTLFTFVQKPIPAKDLNIPERTAARSPTYVIDLNVVFDAVRRRARTKEAGIVSRAGWKNHIRVAISRELKNELERTAKNVKDDPMLGMVSQFWPLEIPPSPRVRELSGSLAPIVFPERTSQGILTVQDKSDLIHLVTAIENNAAGFVTSETKILAASNYLRSEYGLDVISLYDLAELVEDEDSDEEGQFEFAAFSDDFVAYRTTCATDPKVKAAVTKLGVESRFLPATEQSPADKINILVVVDRIDNPLGFAWWTSFPGPTPKNHAFIAAKEDSECCQGVVDFLCEKIIGEACARDAALVQITSDQEQTTIRNFLVEHGFRASSGKHSEETMLQKVCVGQPIHRENWDQIRLKVSNLTGGVLLQKDMPSGIADDDLISFSSHDGKQLHIAKSDLEHLLSPTLLVTDARDGAIVPITRTWADDLFGTHEQGTLLTPPEAIARRERVYFSDPATFKLLKPGRVILFYESMRVVGGRKALIAVGRITQSNVTMVEDIEDSLLRKGVIDKRMLQDIANRGKQTVTMFDNIMYFRNPISYERLNELECNNGSNFVTATPISANQLEQILIEGQCHV